MSKRTLIRPPQRAARPRRTGNSAKRERRGISELSLRSVRRCAVSKCFAVTAAPKTERGKAALCLLRQGVSASASSVYPKGRRVSGIVAQMPFRQIRCINFVAPPRRKATKKRSAAKAATKNKRLGKPPNRLFLKFRIKTPVRTYFF